MSTELTDLLMTAGSSGLIAAVGTVGLVALPWGRHELAEVVGACGALGRSAQTRFGGVPARVTDAAGALFARARLTSGRRQPALGLTGPTAAATALSTAAPVR